MSRLLRRAGRLSGFLALLVAVLASTAELSTLDPHALRADPDGFGSHAPDPSGRTVPLALVPVGFPAGGYHALHPQPTYGYGGAVALAQRLVDAFYGLRP